MNTNSNLKRQKLRVLLKVLVFSASILLLIVFFKSLFPASNKKENHKIYNLIEMDLRGIQPGEIRKIRFAGNEVAILRRKNMEFKAIKAEEISQSLSSPLLNKNSRSILPEYFVYFNAGDSGNCPLFYDGKGFKDICSQKRFDNTGREIGKEQQGYEIKIPPHIFKMSEGEVTTLLVGKW